MARPIKDGLDYFPVDVIFDEKIQAVESVFGNDGLVWIIKFWQLAYRSNNGEVSLDNYRGIIHRDNSRVTSEKHEEILKLCLEIGLLVRLGDGKYTSNGIKKRLDYVLKERERWRIKHKINYSEVISPIIPRDNREETRQSKGKESKYIHTVCRDDIRTVINSYIELKKWDKGNSTLLTDIYKRNGRAAKNLLEVSKDAKEACDVMNKLATIYAPKNLNWTIETVVKWYPEYSKKKPISRGDI